MPPTVAAPPTPCLAPQIQLPPKVYFKPGCLEVALRDLEGKRVRCPAGCNRDGRRAAGAGRDPPLDGRPAAHLHCWVARPPGSVTHHPAAAVTMQHPSRTHPAPDHAPPPPARLHRDGPLPVRERPGRQGHRRAGPDQRAAPGALQQRVQIALASDRSTPSFVWLAGASAPQCCCGAWLPRRSRPPLQLAAAQTSPHSPPPHCVPPRPSPACRQTRRSPPSATAWRRSTTSSPTSSSRSAAARPWMPPR